MCDRSASVFWPVKGHVFSIAINTFLCQDSALNPCACELRETIVLADASGAQGHIALQNVTGKKLHTPFKTFNQETNKPTTCLLHDNTAHAGQHGV